MGTGNLGQGTGDREAGAGNWDREVGGRELEAANSGQGTWDRELGQQTETGNWRQGTGTGNLGRELGAANWRQGTWDRELGTGNWGQGTGAGNWGAGTGAANWGQGTWEGSGDRELGAGNWDRELGEGPGGSKLGTGNLGQGTGDRELGAGNWGRELGGRELGAANWGQGTWDREVGTGTGNWRAGNWGQGTGGGNWNWRQRTRGRVRIQKMKMGALVFSVPRMRNQQIFEANSGFNLPTTLPFSMFEAKNWPQIELEPDRSETGTQSMSDPMPIPTGEMKVESLLDTLVWATNRLACYQEMSEPSGVLDLKMEAQATSHGEDVRRTLALAAHTKVAGNAAVPVTSALKGMAKSSENATWQLSGSGKVTNIKDHLLSRDKCLGRKDAGCHHKCPRGYCGHEREPEGGQSFVEGAGGWPEVGNGSCCGWRRTSVFCCGNSSGASRPSDTGRGSKTRLGSLWWSCKKILYQWAI